MCEFVKKEKKTKKEGILSINCINPFQSFVKDPQDGKKKYRNVTNMADCSGP
jgi:hypothetical protein